MRKEIYKDTPGHTHNGRMSEVGAVITQISGFGIPIDPDNYWNSSGAQAAAVDAHVYAGLTYDYMNLTLARNGFEDSGNGMITIVEVQGQFDNATFDTTSKAVLITQPGPGHFSIAGALDVVAHEWGHGIIWRTSNLDIPGEPGSLDESFAWMFGAAVEYAYEGPSSMWKCGEDIYRNGNYDYDMANPHQSPLDPQPDTYGPEDEYWIDVTLCQPTQYNEYCWRWHNAGIPNKMFYLLANGGTHNGVAVTGIGVANAMEIMYEANRKRYWTELTDFVHAATGSIRAAFDLNYISNWPQQTSRAWTAVKVCTIMPGDLDASGYVSLPDVIRLVNFLFDKDRPATSCLGSSPGNCWTPDPLCRAEMDASGNIRLPDVIWLVNFVFDKDRPGLSCLGTGSIPCWLSIPTDYCCKLP
jgi:Zn-dependent metalloprotease